MAAVKNYEFVVSGTAEDVSVRKLGQYDFLFITVDGTEYKDFAGSGPKGSTIEDMESGEEVNIYSYLNGKYTNYSIRRVSDDNIGTSEKPKATAKAAPAAKAKAPTKQAPSNISSDEAIRFRMKPERERDNLHMALSAARTVAIALIPLMVEMGAIPATKVKSTMKNNKGEAMVLGILEHYTRLVYQMNMRIAENPLEEFDFADVLAAVKALDYFADEEEV